MLRRLFSPLIFCDLICLSLARRGLPSGSLALPLLPSLHSLRALSLFLPSLALYREERRAPIRGLVSLSQRCHYWSPTGLMLIYTHR